MPELTPTLATALLGASGELLHVFPAMPFDSSKATEGYVPCLILPAPRPIEQCPEEWKDGRWVWIWIQKDLHSSWCSFRWDDENWIDEDSESIDWYVSYGGTPTHIMLPPPAPQEAQDAR